MLRSAQAIAVGVVLALLGLLVWDVAHSTTSKVAEDLNAGKRIAAPAFVKNRLNAPGKMSLASLRGKVVVLNFWASWCEPCKGEAKLLVAGNNAWKKKGVVFVGVDEYDAHGPALAFMKHYGITYPVISDTGSMAAKYGVTGQPETFFITRRGELVPPHIFGKVTPKTLDEGIRNAIKA
jgi:cytochrome c biogenesis protein CcmG/thiol:disulfide interchange protein DsbE